MNFPRQKKNIYIYIYIKNNEDYLHVFHCSCYKPVVNSRDDVILGNVLK